MPTPHPTDQAAQTKMLWDSRRIPEIPEDLAEIVRENWQAYCRTRSAEIPLFTMESYWALHCFGILDGIGRLGTADTSGDGDSMEDGSRNVMTESDFWESLTTIDEAKLLALLPCSLLKEIEIACRVVEGWAETVWEFQFENTTDRPRITEAAFPVPEAAVINEVKFLAGEAVTNTELHPAGQFYQGCEEIVPGIVCMRTGLLAPGQRTSIRIHGYIPIHPSGHHNELVLPLGLPLTHPKGEMLMRRDCGIGIFPDTTVSHCASRTTPAIQAAHFPKLRITVDIPRENAVPQTIISGTHEVFVYLNQADVRAVLPDHTQNFGDSFRLRWATPPKDRMSRVTTSVCGQHQYHIARIFSPHAATPSDSFQKECTIILAWFTSMSAKERQLALDCLAVAVASLHSETKLRLCILGREPRWWSETQVAVSQFPVSEVLSRIRDFPTGPAVKSFDGVQSSHRMWIGPASCPVPLPWKDKPCAIFIGQSRPHHHEEWLRALNLAVSILPGDSPAEIVPPLVARQFHQNWKSSIDGTIALEKPSYDYDFRIASNDSLVFLTRTVATEQKLGVKFDSRHKMELEVHPSDWDAPQLLWARSRLLYANEYQKEALFKETREAHGILTPHSMFTTGTPQELPPGTRLNCQPMP